jgi:hypothetical protein
MRVASTSQYPHTLQESPLSASGRFVAYSPCREHCKRPAGLASSAVRLPSRANGPDRRHSWRSVTDERPRSVRRRSAKSRRPALLSTPSKTLCDGRHPVPFDSSHRNKCIGDRKDSSTLEPIFVRLAQSSMDKSVRRRPSQYIRSLRYGSPKQSFTSATGRCGSPRLVEQYNQRFSGRSND